MTRTLTAIALSLSIVVVAPSATAQGNPYLVTHRIPIGPQSVNFPWERADLTSTATGTFVVPQTQPQGRTLRAIWMQLEMVVSATVQIVPLALVPFEAVNVNSTITPTAMPGGSAPLTTSVFFNATKNVGNPPLPQLTFPFGPAGNQSGTGSIASTAFASYIGGGTVNVPLRVSFARNAFSSQTGTTVNRQFSYSTTFTLVVTYDYTPIAATATFGSGCAGTAGVPQLQPTGGLPALGNAAFGAALANALPNTPALLLLNLRADLPIGGGCTIHPGLPAIGLGTATDVTGSAAIPIPIPNDLGLLGLELVAQWAVVDPLGVTLPGLGAFAFSGGLTLSIGT